MNRLGGVAGRLLLAAILLVPVLIPLIAWRSGCMRVRYDDQRPLTAFEKAAQLEPQASS